MVPTKTGDETPSSPRRRARVKGTPPAQNSKRLNDDSTSETGTDSSKRRRQNKRARKPEQHPAEVVQSPKKSPGKTPAAKARRGIIDFGALTPLHQKKANAELLKETDLTERWGSKVVMKSTRGRIATPRKPLSYAPPHNLSSQLFSSSPEKGARFEQDFMSEDSVQDDEMGTVVGLDDDTIVLERSLVENEGFTMVSIDALKNRKEEFSGIAENNEESGEEEEADEGHLRGIIYQDHASQRSSPKVVASTRPSNTSIGVENQSQLSRQSVQSSVSNQHQVPKSQQGFLSSSPSMISEARLGFKSSPDLFAGFGNGTKRELKKGLAMGELMARTERGFLSDVATGHKSSPLESRTPLTTPSLYPRLPTPADSQEAETAPSSSKAQIITRENQHKSSKTRDMVASSPPSSPSGDEDLNEEAELSHSQQMTLGFHRERNNIIQQVDITNTSHVMLIESDEEGSPEEESPAEESSEEESLEEESLESPEEDEIDGDGDIWQEVAGRHVRTSSKPEISAARHVRPVQAEQNATPDLRDFFPEDTRPPRSKLPRTWRRTSGNDFLYSDEVEEADSSRGSRVQQGDDLKAQTASEQASGLSAILLHQKLSSVTPVRQFNGVSSSSEHLSPEHASRSVRFDDSTRVGYHNRDAAHSSPLIRVYSPAEARSPRTPDCVENDEDTFMSNGDMHSSSPLTSASHLGISFSQLDTSGISTSDVRQLRRELASTTPRTKKVIVEFNATPVLTVPVKRKRLEEKNTEEDDETIALQPIRKYPRLFDDSSEVSPRNVASKANIDQHISRGTTLPTIVATNAAVSVQTKSNFLIRIANWVFSFPAALIRNPFRSTPPSAPEQILTRANNKESNPEWTLAHWQLLHFLYGRSLGLPASAYGLHSCLFGRPLPSSMLSWIGHEFRSTKFIEFAPGKRPWALRTRESDVRAAYAFIVYAKDPAFEFGFKRPTGSTGHSTNQTRTTSHLTQREDWNTEAGIKEILRSIFAHRVTVLKTKEKNRRAGLAGRAGFVADGPSA